MLTNESIPFRLPSFAHFCVASHPPPSSLEPLCLEPLLLRGVHLGRVKLPLGPQAQARRRRRPLPLEENLGTSTSYTPWSLVGGAMIVYGTGSTWRKKHGAFPKSSSFYVDVLQVSATPLVERWQRPALLRLQMESDRVSQGVRSPMDPCNVRTKRVGT